MLYEPVLPEISLSSCQVDQDLPVTSRPCMRDRPSCGSYLSEDLLDSGTSIVLLLFFGILRHLHVYLMSS